MEDGNMKNFIHSVSEIRKDRTPTLALDRRLDKAIRAKFPGASIEHHNVDFCTSRITTVDGEMEIEWSAL